MSGSKVQHAFQTRTFAFLFPFLALFLKNRFHRLHEDGGRRDGEKTRRKEEKGGEEPFPGTRTALSSVKSARL